MPVRLCSECGGIGYYWTEGGQFADMTEEVRKLIIDLPDPPDGTICLLCHRCQGHKIEVVPNVRPS